jgi:ADP-heptose:LPS heptosyltransferase
MKFLVIRFSSIGDIVLTTPVVRCLKKQLPTAEVHYLSKKTYKHLLITNPYIDKVHLLKSDAKETIQSLQEENFDYVIDLHHNLRSLKIKRALKKKSFSFEKLNIQKWLLTSFKINRLPSLHIVDRYMETVTQFGVSNDGAGLDYFIDEKEKIKEEDIPASHHAGYIALVIGAAVNTKKFPLHKWKELCRVIGHPIILLGGPEDIKEGAEIAEADPIKIYNACGKFHLNESADLLRRAKLVVTNDTGLMHIAAAYKRPLISLWGNTIPEFGMYPYYGENYLAATTSSQNTTSPYQIVEIKNLSCRPCSKIGYSKCPKGHFKCMELIDIDVLKDSILKYLGRKN